MMRKYHFDSICRRGRDREVVVSKRIPARRRDRQNRASAVNMEEMIGSEEGGDIFPTGSLKCILLSNFSRGSGGSNESKPRKGSSSRVSPSASQQCKMPAPKLYQASQKSIEITCKVIKSSGAQQVGIIFSHLTDPYGKRPSEI